MLGRGIDAARAKTRVEAGRSGTLPAGSARKRLFRTGISPNGFYACRATLISNKNKRLHGFLPALTLPGACVGGAFSRRFAQPRRRSGVAQYRQEGKKR
jgi:hypothetical protein